MSAYTEIARYPKPYPTPLDYPGFFNKPRPSLNIPSLEHLNIPKLKNIELPKFENIELPKFKLNFRTFEPNESQKINFSEFLEKYKPREIQFSTPQPLIPESIQRIIIIAILALWIIVCIYGFIKESRNENKTQASRPQLDYYRYIPIIC